MALESALLCLVIAISDGDTLTARCGEQGQFEQVKVRLAEIDAPEKNQPDGQQSKNFLSQLCFQKLASITPMGRDRYGRTIGRVRCGEVDANAAMVKAGMAWAYTQYLTDPEIQVHEADARGKRVGIWADVSPIPPWLFRKGKSHE